MELFSQRCGTAGDKAFPSLDTTDESIFKVAFLSSLVILSSHRLSWLPKR